MGQVANRDVNRGSSGTDGNTVLRLLGGRGRDVAVSEAGEELGSNRVMTTLESGVEDLRGRSPFVVSQRLILSTICTIRNEPIPRL